MLAYYFPIMLITLRIMSHRYEAPSMWALRACFLILSVSDGRHNLQFSQFVWKIDIWKNQDYQKSL